MAQDNAFGDLIPTQGGGRAQPQGGSFRPLTDMPAKVDEKTRPLSTEEIRANYPQLDPNTLYQISPNGTITVVGGQARSQLKPWPSAALDARVNNNAAVRNIEEALRLIDPANKTQDGDNARGAVGFGTGMLGDWVTQINDPEGTSFRAQVGQIGGIQIKDTSGAAVSLSEDERLKKWVPYVTDTPEVVRAKLSNLAREIRNRNAVMDEVYNEEQGFRSFRATPESSRTDQSGQPPAQASAPMVGLAGSGATTTVANPPPEVDAALGEWINRNRGKITPESFAAFGNALLDQYDFTGGRYDPANPAFVNHVKTLNGGGNFGGSAMERDLSQGEQITNDIANSPVGAALIGAGQSVTGNFLDEIAGGNANVGIDQIQRENPWSSAAGQLAGGLLLPMGKAGSAANMAIKGAGYGAVAGAGAGEGDLVDRLPNAALGAGAGAAGGWFGSKFLARQQAKVAQPRAPSKNAQTLAKAEKFGIDLGMDSVGGRTGQIVGNTLDNMLGSATAMQSGRKALGEQVEGAVEGIASQVGRASGNEGLGRAVRRGIEGAMERGKGKVSDLYAKISISPDAPATLPNTIAKLDELTSKFSSNPELAAMKVSPKLTAYRDALKSGGMSWEDLKALRSDIGDDIGEAIIGEGASRSELRGLYGALTQDMEATASSFGPKALAEFRRANDAARRNFDLQEKVFAPIIGKAQDKSAPGIARTFQALVKDGKAGADLVHFAKLRGSMTAEEWGESQGGFIRMMGHPAGSQGREWSAETFARTYADMTDKSRNIMFGSKGPLRESMDDFADVAKVLAERNALRNTSNTAGQVITGTALLSLGNLPGLVAGAGASFGLAKLMRYPPFVRWATGYNRMLAGAAKAGGTPNTAKQVALLSKVAKAEPAIAADVLGLQKALSTVFEQTPMKLAAEEDPNTRTK